MKSRVISVIVVLLSVFSVFGQTLSSELGVKVDFNFEEFKTREISQKKSSKLRIALPLAIGEYKNFTIKENSLSTKTDIVRTYDGVSEDGRNVLKLTVFSDKVEAFILTDRGYVVFEPVTDSENLYRVYRLSDIPAEMMGCGANKHDFIDAKNGLLNSELRKAKANHLPIGDNLRVYRFAAAATGEMVGYFGSQDAALAQIISILNSANLIYEQELAISFQLIDESLNKSIIFTNSSTDPFTPSPSFADANASQTGYNTMNTNGILAYDKYDVGHTFSTLAPLGGGSSSARGQAGPYPCIDNMKSRGWTEWTFGSSLGLIVGVFVHEVGHQFTAWHTYNAQGGSSGSPSFCESGWDDEQAVEPGGGSTLMAYGNNCQVPVQQSLTGDNRLNYFHSVSINAIQEYLNNTGNCFTLRSTGNTPPTADAGIDITIPKSTPFWLNGIATDSDGDALTYTWEQCDAAVANDMGALGSNILGKGGYPATLSTTAPLFRSEQTRSTDRSFPKMKFVLNNQNIPADLEGEALPEVARDMNFSFTVRDGRTGVNSDQITVHVADVGPLAITAPNGGESLSAGSTTTVIWDVNSTNTISTNVSILFSVDGGEGFPYVLAEDIPNNGSYTVTIPNVPNTTKGRIQVAAYLNPNAKFFDVSDGDITVTSSCAAYSSMPCFPDDLEVDVADPALNLGLMQAGSSETISSLNASIGTSQLNPILVYAYQSSDCHTASSNYYTSPFHKIRVAEDGEYTFVNNSGGFVMMTLYSAEVASCQNFISSNASMTSSGSSVSYTTSMTLTLSKCVDYYLLISNFATSGTYNISISGAGNVYTEYGVPNGVNYAYIAVDKSDNTIKEVNGGGDFTGLDEGTYTIYGASFPVDYVFDDLKNKTLDYAQNMYCLVRSYTSMNIQIGNPLSIEGNIKDQDNLILYPSPADDIIYIKSPISIERAEIYNFSGQIRLRVDKLSDQKISLKGLSSGNYIVKLYDSDGKEYIEKIVKR